MIQLFRAPAGWPERYVPDRGDTDTPNIHLKGNWLKEAGFETGVHLTVKISDGCIVIIKDSEKWTY